MDIGFAWDRAKAETNRRVHGISFEVAQEVFNDPNHVVMENYFYADECEQRYQAIGMTQGLIVLLVVFVDRSEDDNVAIIRLISARRANTYEQQVYADATA